MKFKTFLALLTLLVSFFSQAETHKQYGINGPKLTYQGTVTKSTSYVVKGKSYTTKTHKHGKHYSKEGAASYYHSRFNGRRTASGEKYDASAFTAAHKTLPLGSYALITNLANNKKVIVRINDRGPFAKTRIMDLSRAAASEIGMIRAGVGQVRVEALHVDRNGAISGAAAPALAKAARTDAAQKRILTSSLTDKSMPYSMRIVNVETEKQANELQQKLVQNKDIKSKIKRNGNKFELHFENLATKSDVNQLKIALSKLDRKQQLIVYTYH
ncbi:rare lipoprotein A [Mesocricetibacter intestinalis]|uniref:Endolytic peptidoglycan transglycosylase RlpA n=1 Tax=Mesocricetibacter intestinalis TaxID=1521930 RepID=A0A4R6V821_9PAST|nr:septal ring lytic transglycosylase RlpA family protein [Mesocricetibacter intestinalis]TDQ57872.1 rare lipoprotein A [Mesocricetibacter intestinalis]